MTLREAAIDGGWMVLLNLCKGFLGLGLRKERKLEFRPSVQTLTKSTMTFKQLQLFYCADFVLRSFELAANSQPTVNVSSAFSIL